jgi:hypothetical protein
MSATGGAGGVGVHNAAYMVCSKGLRDRVPPECRGEVGPVPGMSAMEVFRMPVVRPGTAPRQPD